MNGGCAAVRGECKATRDEDCRGSWGCADHGACSAVDGRCRAVKDADCALTDLPFGDVSVCFAKEIDLKP